MSPSRAGAKAGEASRATEKALKHEHVAISTVLRDRCGVCFTSPVIPSPSLPQGVCEGAPCGSPPTHNATQHSRVAWPHNTILIQPWPARAPQRPPTPQTRTRVECHTCDMLFSFFFSRLFLSPPFSLLAAPPPPKPILIPIPLHALPLPLRARVAAEKG